MPVRRSIDDRFQTLQNNEIESDRNQNQLMGAGRRLSQVVERMPTQYE